MKRTTEKVRRRTAIPNASPKPNKIPSTITRRKSLGTVSEPQNDDRILLDETDNMIEDNIYSNEFDTIYDKKIFVTINYEESPIPNKENFEKFMEAKEYLISGIFPPVKKNIIKKTKGKKSSFSFWSIFDCFRQTKKSTKRISRSASNIILSPQSQARIMNYSQKF